MVPRAKALSFSSVNLLTHTHTHTYTHIHIDTKHIRTHRGIVRVADAHTMLHRARAHTHTQVWYVADT
jgi:hypothetical protein